jgi:hypothetical protein
MRRLAVEHEFVELMPAEIRDGVVYVSIPYATVIHRCLCGCGEKVVTPLAPDEWSLTFDGETVSLWPSIGNWSFDCQSHYWIKSGRVVWANRWSREKVEANRRRDRQRRGLPGLGADGEASGLDSSQPGRVRHFLGWLHRKVGGS